MSLLSGLSGAFGGSTTQTSTLTIDQSSTVPMPGGRWTYSQLVGLLERNGFSQAQAQIGAAISMAESGGNPNAVGDQGTSFGLFQIHLPAHPDITAAQAENPDIAAQDAYKISSGGTNWNPWSTFTSGAYKQYLNTSAGPTTAVLTSSPTVAAGATNVAQGWGTFGKWALGFGVVAVVIVASSEDSTIRPLAYGVAGLMATYVIFANNGATGKAAWTELKNLVGAS